jgi:Tfp pilus assembly protein PilF
MDDNQILDGAYASVNTWLSAFANNAFFKHSVIEFYRPLQNLSFLLDARLAGGASYLPFHASNLLLFTIAALLLVRLLSTWGYTKTTAWCLTTLFIVNPLNAQAIAWIPGRGDLLLTCAALLWLLTVPGSRSRTTPVTITLHAIATVLALASKENGFVLPFLGIAYGVIAAKPRWSRPMILSYAGAACVLGLLYAYLRIHLLGGVPDPMILSVKNLLHNIAFFPTCLAQAIIPLHVTAVPRYEIVPVILGCLIITAFVFGALRSPAAHKSRLLYAGLWIVLFAVPGLLYRHELGAQSYDYLNQRILILLVGMVIAGAELYTWLIPRSASRILMSVTGIIAVGYAGIAISFANWFKDPATFLSAGIDSQPTCTLLLNNRGIWRRSQGDFAGARADFDRAIRYSPSYAPFYRNRGNLFGDTGDVAAAIKDFSAALSVNPADVDALLGRSHWFVVLQDFAHARADLDRAVALEPENYLVRNNRGILELAEGTFSAARDDFSAAIRINPSLGIAYYNRGQARYELQDADGSCRDLSQAVQLGSAAAQELLMQWCAGSAPAR